MSKIINIGLDVGGVIFTHSGTEDNKQDTSQVTNWFKGAEDGIKTLSASHTVYIVSFAGKATGKATVDVLQHHVPVERIFIVKDRKLKFKPCIENKIDLMVDDREDVLLSIAEQYAKRNLTPPHLILFSPLINQGHIKHVVHSWDELCKLVSSLSSQ